MFYNVIFWHVGVTNHCCRGKAISIHILCLLSYSACKAHEQRVLSSVASLAAPHFSTLSHKRKDFREKMLLNIKCVYWVSLQLLSETFLILRRNGRDMIKNAHRSSRIVPVIRVRYQTWIFSTDCRKIDIKFHENSCSRSRVLPCGRKEGHEEANSRFSRFCERALETCFKTPPVKKTHTSYSYESIWRKTQT